MAQTKTQYIDLSIVNGKKRSSLLFCISCRFSLPIDIWQWLRWFWIYTLIKRTKSSMRTIESNWLAIISKFEHDGVFGVWYFFCFSRLVFRINLIILPIMHKWHNTQILPGLGHESSKKKKIKKNNKRAKSEHSSTSNSFCKILFHSIMIGIIQMKTEMSQFIVNIRWYGIFEKQRENNNNSMHIKQNKTWIYTTFQFQFQVCDILRIIIYR